jgi:uncharacterized cupredoxin-like copper-binding protein
MPHRAAAAAAAAIVSSVLVAGCGSDSSSSDEASSSAKNQQVTSTTPASATPSPQDTGGPIAVSMTEFEFQPDALSVKAGKVRVRAKNTGSAPHEFVVIRTDKAPGALPVKGGEASEAGAVGEIPEQKPGASATHTFRLKPGKYVFICNVPGHYQGGMRGTLTVR